MRNISLTRQPAASMPVSATLQPTDGSEQSLATNGRGIVLYTTNLRDGFSVNGGRSFTGLDPATVFPSAAGGFCCDQVVSYVPSVDRFVWVVQYLSGSGGVPDDTKPNVLRVATATSAELIASNGRRWSYYDWTPSDLGAKAPGRGLSVLLDRTHVAFTRGMFYLSVGLGYTPGNKVFGNSIWRFPIAQLGGTITPSVVTTQSPTRDTHGLDERYAPAQNDIFSNGSIQYFASRESTSRLLVMDWPDTGRGPATYEIDIPSVATQNTGTAAPSGSDWGARYTGQAGRVVTGARRGRVVWFGWNAGRDAPKPAGGVVHLHDQPAVEFVGIDVATKQSVDYDSLEYADFASVNPQIRVNGEGVLGVDFMYGGPSRNPTYAVGFLRPDYAAAVAVSGGAADPSGLGSSGDYLGLAADPGQQNCFVAAGSAIKVRASTATTPTSLFHDPHYVVFGRATHCTVPPTTLTDVILSSVTQDSASGILKVLGSIDPAVPGAHVGIVYTPSTGSPFTHEVIADATGRFSDEVVPAADQGGRWSVTARWFGQDKYIGAQAAASSVEVVAPSATPTPSPGNQPATLTLNCPTGAANSFPADILVGGLLSPSLNGRLVVVTYTPPSGFAIVHTVATAPDGSYGDSVTVNANQTNMTWTAKAHFGGDPTYAAADSATCSFSPHVPG